MIKAIPRKTISLLIAIIMLSVMWLFLVQQHISNIADLSLKKNLVKELILETTSLEIEHIKLLTVHATDLEDNNIFVRENKPIFVRRDHSSGSLSLDY